VTSVFEEDISALDDAAIESELCSLAGHIAAATARMVLLLAEFDRRGAYGRWGCASVAHWMNWKCAMSLHAGRERVRVGRCLADLPVIRDEFSAGRLSYSQARALTRIATPQNDATCASLAQRCTAAQLEKAVRATATVARRRDTDLAVRLHAQRRVTWRFDEDGAVHLSAVMEPHAGAKVIAAIHAFDSPPRLSEPVVLAITRHADALEAVADAALDHPDGGRNGGDQTLVMIHVTPAVMAGSTTDTGADTDDLATSSDPAVAADRCHLDHGPAIAPETARRLGCDCAFVEVTEHDGEPLAIGRKTRSIPPAIRRAVHTRDDHCCFPGCHRRIRQVHHVLQWTRDHGPTELQNCFGYCQQHHWFLHEGGFDVTRVGGQLRHYDASGLELHNPPELVDPHAPADIDSTHAATIASDTITPLWEGDHLSASDAVDMLFPPPPPPWPLAS
jgi:hypothetical protein